MKILHVIPTCDPKSGGPIEGVKQFYKYYKKNGIKSEILCSDSPRNSFLKNKNLPKVYAVGPAKFDYGYNPNLISWLNKNIHKYKCIIINGIWYYHNYAVWKVATKKKIPYYIFTHGMLDPWFKENFPFKHIKKLIYWYLFQYKILKEASCLFFTCKEEKILARKSFSSYDVKEKVVGYGVSLNPYKFNKNNNFFIKKFPQIRDKKIILFFGRVNKKKGLENLIQAFSVIINKYEYKNLHILIVGPYNLDYKNDLKILISNLKLDKLITFTGPIYGKAKWDIFKSCDVFCLPSHQENFGISVVEALSCHKPVLITNKVNIWREIKKAKAGLVSKDNIDGVVNNLKKWLSMSKSNYKTMSKNAFNCFDRNFNTKDTSKILINFLNKNHK